MSFAFRCKTAYEKLLLVWTENCWQKGKMLMYKETLQEAHYSMNFTPFSLCWHGHTININENREIYRENARRNTLDSINNMGDRKKGLPEHETRKPQREGCLVTKAESYRCSAIILNLLGLLIWPSGLWLITTTFSLSFKRSIARYYLLKKTETFSQTNSSKGSKKLFTLPHVLLNLYDILPSVENTT